MQKEQLKKLIHREGCFKMILNFFSNNDIYSETKFQVENFVVNNYFLNSVFLSVYAI